MIATDDGQPPLSSEAKINIEILDENDNLPVFAKPSYKAEILENSKIGIKVTKVIFKEIYYFFIF